MGDKGSWNLNGDTMNHETCDCSSTNWFGYKGWSQSGSMKTTLNKCGRASLKFSNCYKNSEVEAKLNGKQIAKLSGWEIKTIEFDFKDGDIFELADIGYGIVELYDFKIISCSSC